MDESGTQRFWAKAVSAQMRANSAILPCNHDLRQGAEPRLFSFSLPRHEKVVIGMRQA